MFAIYLLYLFVMHRTQNWVCICTHKLFVNSLKVEESTTLFGKQFQLRMVAGRKNDGMHLSLLEDVYTFVDAHELL